MAHAQPAHLGAAGSASSRAGANGFAALHTPAILALIKAFQCGIDAAHLLCPAGVGGHHHGLNLQGILARQPPDGLLVELDRLAVVAGTFGKRDEFGFEGEKATAYRVGIKGHAARCSMAVSRRRAGMRAHFQRFAAYNAWANARLYEAAVRLSDEEWHRDTGAFFTSLAGTLNHLLVADRIWMRRLTSEGETHTKLTDLPFPDFDALRAAREAMDARIIAFVDGLDAASFDEDVHYSNTRGEPHHLPRGLILTHLFNHQTHHRGQAHHILSQLGHEPPPLDLLYFALPAA